MRSYNANFAAQQNAVTKSPRYVVELSFDNDNTDLVYLTSHADAALPNHVTSIKRVIESPSGTSQTINPIQARATIGSMTVTLVDRGASLTSLINQKLNDDMGLRNKRLRLWMGFEGDAWTDYELVQTQIVDQVSFSEEGKYTIRCSDIQRSARDDIFDLRKTTLTATLTATATTLTVASTADFEGLEHGWSYQDAPPYNTGTVSATNGSKNVTGSGTSWLNKTLEGGRINIAGVDYLVDTITDNTHLTLITNYTGTTGSGKSYTIYPRVGYIRLDDEVIRYPISAVTDTTFTKCVRGVLGTKAIIHEVDANADPDRQPEIEEFIYLEMPGPKLLLAILTGSLYGQPGASLPSNWHLAIDPEYIATSDFVDIGTDWWDPSDDRLGRILRFVGEDKTDGKQFYEQQISLILGAFNPVYRDGSLGLKRMTIVISDASPVAYLDESNIVEVGELTHDMGDVHNQLLVKWNYDFIEDEVTRKNLLTDARSISRHGTAPVREVEARGLHGSRHTQDTLFEMFDSLRSRHAGPPQKLRVTCLPRYNFLEVGDCVLVNYKNIRDFAGDYIQLYRTFEVQGVDVDWGSGELSFQLFGSAEAAGAIEGTNAGATLDSAIYTSGGTELSAFLGGSKFEVIGGVGHIKADCTLPGGSTLSAGKYRYNGDLTINAGVTVTITDNVLLAIGGFLELAEGAIIDGKGRGFAGATSTEGNGARGFIGDTQPMGSLKVNNTANIGGTFQLFVSDKRTVTRGLNSAFPTIALQLVDGVLTGIPSDMRGTSGGAGGNLRVALGGGAGSLPITTVGGNGGNGGAGLCVICQGADFDGEINLSGTDGEVGSSAFLYQGQELSEIYQAYSGSGAGGCPGGCLVVLDGAASLSPENVLIANQGITPIPDNAQRCPRSGQFLRAFTPGDNEVYYSYELGLGGLDMSKACFRVMYAPEGTEPEEDIPTLTSIPTAINIDEFQNRPQTPNQNLVTLEVSVTPPTDGNYSYSVIKYRVAGSSSAWLIAGATAPEALIIVPMDGTQYEIAAFPVSIFFVESLEYKSTLYTVPLSTAGGVTLGGGNGGYIRTSPTVGEGSDGQGVIYDEDGVRAYNSSGTLTFELDAATGNIFSSGEADLASGLIGGWEITESTIEKGDVVIDSANERIQVGPTSSTFVRMDADGLLGVDSVLGTTFILPTDGSAPRFSSGIIQNTVYELYTASVIKTSNDPATDGGVLINDTGLKLYNPAGDLTVLMDADTGDVDITGNFTITGGSGAKNFDDIDEVTEDGIEAGVTITAGGITMSSGGSVKGGQSGYDTGTGFFLGYVSSSYKFSIGNASGEKLTFDGTNLTTTGHMKAGSIAAPYFYSAGSHLTSSVSAAATTLPLRDASDFGTSGSGFIIDSSNNKDAFSWTGKSGNSLTGCSGVLAHNANAIVIPSQSMVISSATDEMYGYGNRGDGTLAELFSFGLNSISGDVIIINAGSDVSGFNRVAIRGSSNSSYGLQGYSVSGYGLIASSDDSYGAAVYSDTWVAGLFAGDISGASIELSPVSTNSDPSHEITVGSIQVRKRTTTSLPARAYMNIGMGYGPSAVDSDSWGQMLVAPLSPTENSFTSDQTLGKGFWYLRSAGDIDVLISVDGTTCKIDGMGSNYGNKTGASFYSDGTAFTSGAGLSTQAIHYRYFPM